jgi:high-affinity iron transporter
MLGALIIVFREVIEAGLIVGIVMAATQGVTGRGRWVAIGISAGVLGAAVVAAFAGARA